MMGAESKQGEMSIFVQTVPLTKAEPWRVCVCQPGHNTRVSSAVSQSHVFSVFVLFSYTNEASVPKEGTGWGEGRR